MRYKLQLILTALAIFVATLTIGCCQTPEDRLRECQEAVERVYPAQPTADIARLSGAGYGTCRARYNAETGK